MPPQRFIGPENRGEDFPYESSSSILLNYRVLRESSISESRAKRKKSTPRQVELAHAILYIHTCFKETKVPPKSIIHIKKYHTPSIVEFGRTWIGMGAVKETEKEKGKHASDRQACGTEKEERGSKRGVTCRNTSTHTHAMHRKRLKGLK